MNLLGELRESRFEPKKRRTRGERDVLIESFGHAFPFRQCDSMHVCVVATSELGQLTLKHGERFKQDQFRVGKRIV
jgi:hypothetical protein